MKKIQKEKVKANPGKEIMQEIMQEKPQKKKLIKKKKKRGKVYIASMNMRGKWATCPDGVVKINVTSAQGKANKNRLCFSPMTETGYKGFHCFENYWQSGKVFEGIKHEESIKWWKALKAPKRRYPKGKGKRVLHATFKQDNQHIDMDYITSRKLVYVPEYYNLVKDNENTQSWIKRVMNGEDVAIYDFDGPRDNDGGVKCLEATKELLLEKIHYTRTPFGHGYVVAMLLLGLDVEEITKE